MLQQHGLNSDFGTLLPDDLDVARAALERDLGATLRPARELFEDRVQLLRQWVMSRQSEVADQWLHGLIDGTRAAQLFSILAETVVATLLPQVTTALAYNQGRLLKGRFVVLALGKLGSREMTIQSDLDLLFVYDVPQLVEETDGPEPAPVTAYYAKLGQKLIAALTIMTEKGALFEIDMRLRPFGESGPITSSLSAFRRYYQNDAWTWEHMALCRARVIAGDADLAATVTKEIRAILTRRRERGRILPDVADMRARIAREHSTMIPRDCKHRRGGLVDIEFIAQAYQLIHAATAPDILTVVTRDALLQLGRRGFLPMVVAEELARALEFWQTLQGLVRVTQDRSGLSKVTPNLYDKALLDLTGLEDVAEREARAEAVAAAVRVHYQRIIGDFASAT